MRSWVKEIGISLLASVLFPIVLFSFVTRILPKSDDDIPRESTQNATSGACDAYKTVTLDMCDGTVKPVPMDAYIVSVVLREMPAEFHMEALKAQAVVARTYTMRNMRSSAKHNNADVCVDATCCQGYWDVEDYLRQGGKQTAVDTAQAAVRETAGMILVYDNEPIEATYFSCSGGYTEDAVAVWGADVPYLKATESPGEENAKYYTETVRYPLAQFYAKLGIEARDANEFRIDNITYTAGGGVDSIRICGKNLKGTEVRKLLNLRSTSFTITAVGANVTITTKGYGHRVGMSQYGADAMAQNGADYMQILCHYYQGVAVSSVNDFY